MLYESYIPYDEVNVLYTDYITFALLWCDCSCGASYATLIITIFTSHHSLRRHRTHVPGGTQGGATSQPTAGVGVPAGWYIAAVPLRPTSRHRWWIVRVWLDWSAHYNSISSKHCRCSHCVWSHTGSHGAWRYRKQTYDT